MEATDCTDLQLLREWACTLVERCTDEDLLDLICKLLVQPSGG